MDKLIDRFITGPDILVQVLVALMSCVIKDLCGHVGKQGIVVKIITLQHTQRLTQSSCVSCGEG